LKNTIISKIRAELAKKSTAEARAGAARFFKEPIKTYGVKSADVNRISREAYSTVKTLDKKAIFSLCEILMESGYMEERFIAFHWAEKQVKNFVESDFKTFEKWVNTYVSNWAECDTLCNHTVGSFVVKFPEYIEKLKQWALSSNRWVKRASAVSLILPARHGLFLKDIFEIADILLLDTDDMVQKGYGWMLKAASESHEEDVFKYVMKNKKTMPRTAFRYAIEKMGDELKKRAMK
jgi:3-methyladenine DNA glycosylase AlkD